VIRDDLIPVTRFGIDAAFAKLEGESVGIRRLGIGKAGERQRPVTT